MQIQLKQNEIVAALTGYLAQQGIAVANKKIDISFTAGRKNAGLTADVSIEDGVIPGFTDTPADPVTPKLAVVQVKEAKSAVEPTDNAPAAHVVTTGTNPAESEVPQEPVAEATPKVVNSLFS